ERGDQQHGGDHGGSEVDEQDRAREPRMGGGQLVPGGGRGHGKLGAGAGARLSRRSFRRVAQWYVTGRITSVSTAADSVPPTTTTAIGRCVALPMACDSAAGRSPRQARKAVMRTARRQARVPADTPRSKGAA